MVTPDKMIRSIKIIFLSLIVLSSLAPAGMALANTNITGQEYIELAPIDDLRPTQDRGGDQTAIDYIERVYYFVLTISALLAVVMIIVAGVEFTAYGASEKAVSDAKERITYALVGLLLALSSWLILYIVNPNLVGSELFTPDLKSLGDSRNVPEGEVPSLCLDSTLNKNYGVWGNPCDPNYEAENIITVEAGGTSFRVNKLVAEKFVNFINELESNGYDVTRVDGYNLRRISGSSKLSNHSFGAAIDVDPSKNPLYSSSSGGEFALPPTVGDLASQFGLVWGGNYQNSKDYMHFEDAGAPSSP